MKETTQYYVVQTYRFKELCSMYHVSEKTFRKELDKVPGLSGDERKDIYYPSDVQKIFDHLGAPIKE